MIGTREDASNSRRLGLHEHRHDDAQVIEKADAARDHHDDEQRPERGAAGRDRDVELADEPGRERDAGERQQHARHDRRQPGASRKQAAEVRQPVEIALFAVRQDRDDAERPDRGDEVGDEIERDEAPHEPPRQAPIIPLSDQEQRVLRRFSRGLSAGDVEQELRISPQTLRHHLHHINRKLGTHNRLEAVIHAIRRQLI